MESTKIDNDNVIVKISTCNKCGGIVRTAIEKMMTTRAKNEFAKEVMRFNLSVSTKKLIDFKTEDKKWCECE